MVVITSYISGTRKIFVLRQNIEKSFITYEDALDLLKQKEKCDTDISLSCEGKLVSSQDKFTGDANIIATLKLRGGKGGFGSMLRAIGAQIEKTTNREACRDLSGRRLRDINEEKRLKEFLAKKVDKEKEMIENKKKKLEKMKEGGRHIFEDKSYFDQREKNEKNIYDSLDKAFSSSSGEKSGSCASVKTVKTGFQKAAKKRVMHDLDDSSEDDSDLDSEEQSVIAHPTIVYEDAHLSGQNEDPIKPTGLGDPTNCSEEMSEIASNGNHIKSIEDTHLSEQNEDPIKPKELGDPTNCTEEMSEIASNGNHIRSVEDAVSSSEPIVSPSGDLAKLSDEKEDICSDTKRKHDLNDESKRKKLKID